MHSPATLEPHEHALAYPDFAGRTICDLIPTAASLLGYKFGERPGVLGRPLVDASDHDLVVVLLVDTLSKRFFDRVCLRVPLAPDGTRSTTLSSIFPTLTQACLPSIWSAAPPAVHGVYGRFFFDAETGRTHGPGVRPGDVVDSQDEETERRLGIWSLADELEASGVAIEVFATSIQRRFTRIVYGRRRVRFAVLNTAASFGDARVASIENKSTDRLQTDIDLLDEVERVARVSRGPSLLFVHLMGFGHVAHAFRSDGEELIEASAPFWERLQTFLVRVSTRKRTAVILTSDHGLVDIDAEDSVILNEADLATLDNLLAAEPAGNHRSVSFAPRSGAVEELGDFLRELPGAGCPIQLDALSHSRLYGGEAAYPGRAGQLLLLNVGRGIVHLANDLPFKAIKQSDHGGLDPDEMTVPFCLISDQASPIRKERSSGRC